MRGTECVTGSEVESAGSRTLIQALVREAEDVSSPLSSSPSAKMIKIEEIADVSSHSSEQLVASSPHFQDTDFCLWVLITGKVLTVPPCKHILAPRVPQEEDAYHPLPPLPLSADPSPAEAELPTPPTNSFQLEAQLRKIGNQPNVVYRYLRVSSL